MKLILAMISPDKLDAVQAVLWPLDAAAAYISTVGDLEQLCVGNYRGGRLLFTASSNAPGNRRCKRHAAPDIVDQIAVAAAIDERGNRGSLFVLPLQAWIRRPGNDTGSASELEEQSYAAWGR